MRDIFSYLTEKSEISALLCEDIEEVVVPLHEEFATEAALQKVKFACYLRLGCICMVVEFCLKRDSDCSWVE